MIADRPYKASFQCIKSDSFAYVMAKVDFVRFFRKQGGESWRILMNISKQKEIVDIKAYENYFNVAKQPTTKQPLETKAT